MHTRSETLSVVNPQSMTSLDDKEVLSDVIKPVVFEKMQKTAGWHDYPEKTIHLHLPLCIGFKEPGKFASNFDAVAEAFVVKRNELADSDTPFTFTIYLYCNPDDRTAVAAWKKKYANILARENVSIIDIEVWRGSHSATLTGAKDQWRESVEKGEFPLFYSKFSSLLELDADQYLNRSCMNPADKKKYREQARKNLFGEIIDVFAWAIENKGRMNILLHEGAICKILNHFLMNLDIFKFEKGVDFFYQDLKLSESLLTAKQQTKQDDPLPAKKDIPGSSYAAVPSLKQKSVAIPRDDEMMFMLEMPSSSQQADAHPHTRKALPSSATPNLIVSSSPQHDKTVKVDPYDKVEIAVMTEFYKNIHPDMRTTPGAAASEASFLAFAYLERKREQARNQEPLLDRGRGLKKSCSLPSSPTEDKSSYAQNERSLSVSPPSSKGMFSQQNSPLAAEIYRSGELDVKKRI